MPDTPHPHRRRGLLGGLRSSFLTGLVVVLPIGLTIYLIWTVIGWIDSWVLPLVPSQWQPDSILRDLLGPETAYSVRGVGVIVFLVFTIIVGWIAKGLIGRSVLRMTEGLVDRMPVVRSIYNGPSPPTPLFRSHLDHRQGRDGPPSGRTGSGADRLRAHHPQPHIGLSGVRPRERGDPAGNDAGRGGQDDHFGGTGLSQPERPLQTPARRGLIGTGRVARHAKPMTAKPKKTPAQGGRQVMRQVSYRQETYRAVGMLYAVLNVSAKLKV